MKRILTAALALTLLGGTAVLAQQGGGPQRNNRGDNFEGRGGNGQDHNDRGRNHQNRKGQGVNERGENRDRRPGTSARQNSKRWSRGDRLPKKYWGNQYHVSDWRQHGLKSPPRGHRWYRDEHNDYFLAAIATGIIATVIYRDQRDQR